MAELSRRAGPRKITQKARSISYTFLPAAAMDSTWGGWIDRDNEHWFDEDEPDGVKAWVG